jgi:cation-transporting ATPase 13A2
VICEAGLWRKILSIRSYILYLSTGGGHNPDSEIDWTSVDDEKHKLDPYTLRPIVQEYALGFDPGETEQPDYQLALTGDVFRWMLEFAPIETMQRVRSTNQLA